jgi:PLP dependent protein
VSDPAAVGARLDAVRERIARAAGRAHRDPSSICLVAVSKTFSPDHIRAAADAGQTDFGENKVQEALGKMADTSDLPLRWHFIGHLQSNKARKAAGPFAVVHSVDSVSLLGKIDEGAAEAGTTLELLVQVDLAGEATKHGVPPDGVLEILNAGRGLRAARLTGLMTIPPPARNPEATRPYFQALRALRGQLLEQDVRPGMLRDLSMGMSDDFEVAVEEGATIIRVGSAIFGERTYV